MQLKRKKKNFSFPLALATPPVHDDTSQISSLLVKAARVEVRTQGCVHQDGVVKLSGGLGDVDRLHLLEAAQRMTLWHQLRDGSLVQSPGDQQDDVIDHVAVPEASGKKGVS